MKLREDYPAANGRLRTGRDARSTTAFEAGRLRLDLSALPKTVRDQEGTGRVMSQIAEQIKFNSIQSYCLNMVIIDQRYALNDDIFTSMVSNSTYEPFVK